MSARSSLAPSVAPRRRFTDRGGFTLVEVLVAFAVMATLLSVLFRGVVVMRAGSIAFDQRTHQEFVARAVLDDALAKRDLANGSYSGLREGSRWTLVAKSVDLSAQLPPPDRRAETATAGQNQQGVQEQGKQEQKKDEKPTWVPQRLMVQVDTKGRPLEVETIRLVKAE